MASGRGLPTRLGKLDPAAILLTLIATGTVAGLVPLAIGDAFEGLESKLVLSVISFTGFGLTALVGLLRAKKSEGALIGKFTVLGSLIAFGLSMPAIWGNANGPQPLVGPTLMATGAVLVLTQASLIGIGIRREDGALLLFAKVTTQLLVVLAGLLLLLIAALSNDHH